MKKQCVSYWYPICFLAMWCILSCSKSSDAQEPEIEPPVGVIDAALVGTWTGTLNGSLGEADMSMMLTDKGVMSAEGSTSLYCPINATWEVIGGKFKAKGNDECDGTAVTFDAPYSKTKLVGSWNANSGNSGTFTAEKQ